MKMSTNKPGVTPLGLVVAALIVCVLASLALPRLRDASRGEEASGPPRVLATFEPAVSVAAEVVGSGVVVTCRSCVPESGTSRR
jgi:ABC-type Zn uptake system ZnuABC Zn-binding protein ZnuA